MKNWLKILKFTLTQALRGRKFIGATIAFGLVILIGAAGANILVSGALDKDAQIKALKAVYIANEADFSLDTDSFIQKHEKDYPQLQITELPDISPQKAAADPESYILEADYAIVLEIAEDKDNCNLTVYIPESSKISVDESADFVEEFSDTIKNAKIKNTGVSEDKLNMAISEIRFNETKADAVDEENDFSFVTYMMHMLVMLILYFMVIFYGQSIGQIVSMEKTSKLMEYILTLSEPSGIIFGKVTAVFCEAVIQITTWIICGFCGVTISNYFIRSLTGESGKSITASFMEALPEGGVTKNFAVLLILAIIALLAAFLFYSFVSALFASFAATAEELTQTSSISVLTMVFAFIASLYIPSYSDSKMAGTIIRIIPFTSAFSLPSDIVTGEIGIVEYVLYVALLLVFTVLLAIITGRVYKNRLFKRGTKGIFAEIWAAITGKVLTEPEEEAKKDTVIDVTSYERHDKAKKTFTIVGFALLVFMLAANVLGGLVGSVIGNLIAAQKHVSLSEVYEDTSFLVLNNCIAIYLIAFPLSALIMKLTNDSIVKTKSTLTKSQYFRAICISFPVMLSLNIFSTRLASLVSGGEAENSTINTLVSGHNIPAMIMVAVLAPIFEELLFRKLIIDRTRRYGDVIAIFYSSIAFGLFHCNIYQLFYAFALGLILGYVYVKSGNIILTIIIHMIINGTSSIFAPLAPTAYTYFLDIMLVLGGLSIIYTLIKRDVKFESAKDQIPYKEASAIAFRNSGTILFALVCIIIMIYSLFAPIILN